MYYLKILYFLFLIIENRNQFFRIYLVIIFENNFEKWFLKTIFKNCFLIFTKQKTNWKLKMFLTYFLIFLNMFQK